MFSSFNKSYQLTLFSLVAAALVVNGLAFSAASQNSSLAQQRIVARSNSKDKNEADTFPVTFEDVAGRAGLSEPIIYGGVEQKKYIIETNGCGVAFLDYDNDGWVDILLLNGTRLEGFPKGKEPQIKLYRNKRCLLYTSPSPRDRQKSRMPSSA